MTQGSHSVIWDASGNPSGTYIVKMIADEYMNTQNIMLVK